MSGEDGILPQITNLYAAASGSGGTPLPPARCKSCSPALVKYAGDFVAPEDRDRRMGLLARSDVTEIYRAERRHRELREAPERACTDTLAGPLNQEGITAKAAAC